MSTRSAVSVGLLLLAGVLVLALALWLRAGGSPAARSWMSTGPTEEWVPERLVVLGLPLAGIALIGVAGLALPGDWRIVRALATGVLILLVPFVLWFILAFIPIPGFLYPRWARLIRESRRSWSLHRP